MFGSSLSTSACQRGGVDSGNYTFTNNQQNTTIFKKAPARIQNQQH